MSDPVFSFSGDLLSNSISLAQQNEYNKESSSKAYSRSLDAQALAPRLYASGLRSAGLPISMAQHGAGFQPASSPSPLPLSSHPASMSSAVGASAAAEQAHAETDLVAAQAELLGAQAAHQEIMNTRLRDEDFTLDSNIRGLLESWADDPSNPARQSAASLMLASNELYTRGTADGLRLWSQIVDSNDQLATDAVAREFVRLVYQEKKNNGSAAALANMDKAELTKLAREIVLLEAEASKVNTESDVNKSRLEEIAAHVSDMIESKDLKYSQNLVKQYSSGDKKAVFINLFNKAVNAAAAGAGFYLGAKGAGAASRKLAPTSQRYFDSISKLKPFPNGSIRQPSFDNMSRSDKNKKLLSYY